MRVIWKHKWTIQTTGIKFSDTFKLLRVRVWREWHFHSRNEKKLMFPHQIFLTLSFKICCYYIKEDYLLVTIYFECFGYLFYSLWSGILNCWSTGVYKIPQRWTTYCNNYILKKQWPTFRRTRFVSMLLKENEQYEYSVTNELVDRYYPRKI